MQKVIKIISQGSWRKVKYMNEGEVAMDLYKKRTIIEKLSNP